MLACGVAVSLVFSTAEVLVVNASIGAAFLLPNAVFWWLYVRVGVKGCWKGASFSAVLQSNKNLSERCKVLTRYYYLGMFISLVLFAVLAVLLRSEGLAAYVLF